MAKNQATGASATASATEHALASRRLSLAARMFLLVAALLLVAVGAAVWVSFQQGAAVAQRAINHALQASGEVQAEFAAQRLAEVELKVQLIAADAAFVNYVSESQGGVPGSAPAELAETASIYDLVIERQQAFGFDLGMVLDPFGNVLARSDQPEPIEATFAEDLFVRSAVEPVAPISGYWRMSTSLYQAAIWPLDQGGDLVGFLIVARAVDDAMAERIRAVSDTHVAFLLPSDSRIDISASSLAQADQAKLTAALAQASFLTESVRSTGRLDRFDLSLGDARWVAQLRPLSVDGGAMIGSALQLTSLDEAEAGYRSILNTLAWAGLVTLLVALPLTFLLSRATLRPLRDMAGAAKAAVAGNYQARIGLRGNDELAELSQAFDSLLSDLRGERDIEAYMSHLSRLLPEGSDEPLAEAAPGLAPAQWQHVVLLGVEFRTALQAAADPQAAAALAAELCTGFAALAPEQGGRWLGLQCGRGLIAFSGVDGLARALRTAGAALAARPDLFGGIAEGELLHGDLLRGAPHADAYAAATLGPVAQSVERLCHEGGAGWILMSKAVGEAARQAFADTPIKIAKGALSGKAFFAVSGQALVKLAALEPSAIAAARTLQQAATLTSPAAPIGHELAAGRRLGGRFRIISVLGRGGMGVVYKARDLELDDLVALKMLKGEALRDAEQLERLKSEIKLARKITHPNVLRTFDFGEIDGVPFISMEYVRGMTLRYLLSQPERIPYSAALRIARQCCAGLEAAHAVGVLHRDIKPENLILESGGNAKLMDFGIARPVRRSAPGQTEPGTYVGTPAYSAPEQLTGAEVDTRADVFACGVLMFELFCGAVPFTGTNTLEIYMAQMQGEPAPPRDLNPEISEALAAILLRCLQRRPEDRYQNVTALCQALASLRA
jgi:serine/threonine-protein kinase